MERLKDVESAAPLLQPPVRMAGPGVSAVVDSTGNEYLKGEEWKRMDGRKAPLSFSEKIFQRLYGDLPYKERLRALWLAGTLFFIIGGYWLLRSLKDPIVSAILGVEYIPKCKMMSLVVVFVLVFIYNKLLDIFPKHQLFYIVGGFYAIVFGIISLMLSDPNMGIQNTVTSPYRYLGWVSYCTIESFGSICISLFWAFVNSTMNFEGAKSAYGIIIAGSQVGSILGPTIAANFVNTVGVAKLYSAGAVSMGMMVIMMWSYVNIFGLPESLEQEKSGKKEKNAGVLEGFRLFLKYEYVRGIFYLSCLFMVEVTILDYMMKVLARKSFDDKFPDDTVAATRAFAAFMGLFGQVTNTISFTFSLLGTSIVIRRLGLRKTLLAFPFLCLCVVLMVIAMPTLWTIFGAMILLKGFSYSLNNPCKEMLYQPTSTDVRFKSKSWIDIFGARGSKATGSIVTNTFASSVTGLVHYGGGVAVCASLFLMYIARQMGALFEEYTESGHVVGEEDNEYAVELGTLGDDEECEENSLNDAEQAAGLGPETLESQASYRTPTQEGSTVEEEREVEETLRKEATTQLVGLHSNSAERHLAV